MNIELTILSPKKQIVIPVKYYRQLSALQDCSDNRRNLYYGPISTGAIYHCYRATMEKLAWWLWDAAKEYGYRNASFKVSRKSDNEFELEQTDNPFDSYWVGNILGPISRQFGFSDLWADWTKDP